jgi:hypothetical protein
MIDEDLGAFFDTDDFGTAATWFSGGIGSGAEVFGIFSNGFASPGLGPLAAADAEITFRCAAADVTGVARGDTLKVSGTTYRLVEPRPDGTGLVLLVLKRG